MMSQMKFSRIGALLALASTLVLSACGGGRRADDRQQVAGAGTSSGERLYRTRARHGGCQAFEINLWQNIRGQNRCGSCHNATSPAQMPNFARSDDVNLAYAQANTVVNLRESLDLIDGHQGGRRSQLLARGPLRLRPDLDHVDQQLGGRRGRHAPRPPCSCRRRPMQTVGQSLNFPGDQRRRFTAALYICSPAKYCVGCHSPDGRPAATVAVLRGSPDLAIAYPAAIPKIDFTGLRGAAQNGDYLRHQLALLSAPAHRQPQLLGQLRARMPPNARADPERSPRR